MTYNSRKPKNPFTKMTIELVSTAEERFNSDELVELLKEIRFDLININLSTLKDNVEVKGRGFIPIGFVNKFYIREEDGHYVFDVAISSKFAETIEALHEKFDFGIAARAFTNREGKITKIISLDLVVCDYN